MFQMTCEGEGAELLPRDASNLVVEGAKLAFRAAGFAEMPPLAFHLVNRIPIAAGLGSSSAAIVAGLLAGQVLTGKQLPVEREEAALQLASEVEGHVDNLAPCIYGGLQVSEIARGGGGMLKSTLVHVPRLADICFRLASTQALDGIAPASASLLLLGCSASSLCRSSGRARTALVLSCLPASPGQMRSLTSAASRSSSTPSSLAALTTSP